jgi:hypothetical protein
VGFNVTDVVEPMNWDFSDATRIPDASPDDKGIIPEPNTDAVDLFRARYWGLLDQLNKAAVNTEQREDETPVEAANRILEDAKRPLDDRIREWAERTAEPDKNAQMIDEEMRRIIADVCGGSPTLAQLSKLPSRHFRAFCSWLNDQLEHPKFNFAGTD